MRKKRESWSSNIGFSFAAIGSAVGLANIWKFPYMVGQNGGAVFIIFYLFCIFIISFPVFIAEVLAGRSAQSSTCGTFQKLGNRRWRRAGFLMVITSIVVSAFYCVVAGWVVGYLVEAIRGNLTNFNSIAESRHFYVSLISSPLWNICFQFCFVLLSCLILYAGIRNGIERGTKLMMPILFVILIVLVVKGLMLPGAMGGLSFLFSPDWTLLTPKIMLVALGQAFFSLSLGQGTMIAYGSYLSKKENIIKTCLPIAIIDTFISLLAGIAVFTVVFATKTEPTGGPGLFFHTLPYAFSKMFGGRILALFFFLLIFIAAITSAISAMEVFVSYLIDEKKLSRARSVLISGITVFLLGVPAALSFNCFSHFQLFDMNIFMLMDFSATSVLIPLGGLMAILLVGWKWGMKAAGQNLHVGAAKNKWLNIYFRLAFKYIAPVSIVIIIVNKIIRAF